MIDWLYHLVTIYLIASLGIFITLAIWDAVGKNENT